MSLVTISNVNGFELGIRKTEIRSIKSEMEKVKESGFSGSKKYQELKENLKECRRELKALCSNVRHNFAY